MLGTDLLAQLQLRLTQTARIATQQSERALRRLSPLQFYEVLVRSSPEQPPGR